MGAFSKKIVDFSSKTISDCKKVRDSAVSKMAAEMQLTKPQGGRVPFQFGMLANSLVATTNGMPQADGKIRGTDVGATIASTPVNNPIWLAYTVKYAQRQNYGFVGVDGMGRHYNQAGSHFVEAAIGNWQKYVLEAIGEVAK